MAGPLHTAVHALAFVAGVAVVLLTFLSAVRTVILPRAVPTRLGRMTATVTRGAFRVLSGRTPSYERRDSVFALYGPVGLLNLQASWLLVVYLGSAAIFWALDAGGIRHCLTLSGSSLLTLGFAIPHSGPQTAVTFLEAVIGLLLLALLITYLPSVYTAFSRREQAVSKLEVRAGTPPTGTEMIWRAYSLQREDVLLATFAEWESWFVDIEETHTSFPMLAYFRSPQPDHSWVTAAGAVLDAAALYASSVERERSADPQLCIRAGRIALTRIAVYYGLTVPASISYGDPVTVSRSEYDDALERMAAGGAPIVADRDRAYADFAGWRVNYDVPLVALAALTYAPYAPWSSDRSLARQRSGRLRRRRDSRPPPPPEVRLPGG
ncbi:MAG TPA: hypothetical protein VF288_00620 [Mycobacteriales bacterium]